MTARERLAAVRLTPGAPRAVEGSSAKSVRWQVPITVTNDSDEPVMGIEVQVGLRGPGTLAHFAFHAREHYFDKPVEPGKSETIELEFPAYPVGFGADEIKTDVMLAHLLKAKPAVADAWSPVDPKKDLAKQQAGVTLVLPDGHRAATALAPKHTKID